MSSIYVVDGNTADRELVFDALRDEEHDVMCFSNTRVALRTCAGNPPALLITEAVFAEMTGFGLIRRVRAIAPDVPVLVFTRAYTREDIVALTQGSDRIGFLGKPAGARAIRAAAEIALLAQAWLGPKISGRSDIAPAVPEHSVTTTDERLIHEWRVDALRREGYPRLLAEDIATHGEVDLHDAIDLVRRGCRPELAARILV